jgi:hypothetical protein
MEHLYKNDSQRPYIRSNGHQRPRKEFWREVVISPLEFPESKTSVKGRRQHVGNNQLSLMEQDVVWFEVSVAYFEPM